MNTKRLIACLALICAIFALTATEGRADTLNFSVNTAPLSGYSGPFTLDFQFIGGSAAPDSNNTITISNIMGATPVGLPSTDGGASGTVATSITLTDSSFFNEFLQDFTRLGNTLSFTVNYTTNVDAGPTPDEFTFAILNNGIEVPTTGPNDRLLIITLNSRTPTPQSYSIRPAAPTATPEPATMILLGTGLAGLAGQVRRRRQANQRLRT